jgi:hypothetical protein
MTKLVEAYNAAVKTVLTKAPVGDDGTTGSQRGGTCGLYSLWYATILLSIVDPGDKRPPIYPRKHMLTSGMSSRQYSKSIGSGQGEVLSWYEMFSIINRFGYECDVAEAAEEALPGEEATGPLCLYGRRGPGAELSSDCRLQ